MDKQPTPMFAFVTNKRKTEYGDEEGGGTYEIRVWLSSADWHQIPGSVFARTKVLPTDFGQWLTVDDSFYGQVRVGQKLTLTP